MQAINTYNYIVPASGTTRGVVITETLSATPITKDFRDFGQDGLPFIPSGVYIDNTQGTAPCIIVINEIGFRVVAQAGQSVVSQYPAPSNQTVSIVGGGEATIVFVDYPVIPFELGAATAPQAVQIDGGTIESIGETTDIAAQTPTAPATLIAINKGLMAEIITLQTNVDNLRDIKLVQLDSAGDPLPDSFDTLPQSLEYDGADNVISTTVVAGADSYKQTYTYTGANLTNISGWVKQ